MEETLREYHEVSNIFPLMQGQEFDGLKADILENGLREPIWIDSQGKIIDGRNRHRACIETGTAPIFRAYTGNDLVGFVVSLNLHRRHLTESQRAVVAAKLANMPKGGYGSNQFESKSANLQICSITQPEAAEMLNVSTRSVANARQVIDNGIPELMIAVQDGDIAVSRAAQISKLEPEEQIEAIKSPHVLKNTGNNEWYTPVEIIDSAYKVMGQIDLDPASSEEANKTIGAIKYFTEEDNGLDSGWFGRVWMNPPYSNGLIDGFTRKLVQHYNNGDIPEAIVLVNNATETLWFSGLVDAGSAIVFPRGRIKFVKPEGCAANSPLQGQAIIYIGNNRQKFLDEYLQFGWGAEIKK